MSAVLERTEVVLVRPSHPGNIGAAARAMKTMGLGRLRLVQPRHFPDAAATALAANATDVIERATVHATLDEALAGSTLQYAFSARARALAHAPVSVRVAAAEAAQAPGTVALVFGNETYGLSNEELLKCNRFACIPTDPASSSLNLAAAVQVAVYELRLAALGEGAGFSAAAPAGEPAEHADIERLHAHLERSLVASGFLQADNPRRLLERLRRLFGRAGLEREEVNILRGMLSAWDQGPYCPPADRAPATPDAIVDKSTRK